MTHTMKIYAGAYPHRADLKLRGFVYDPTDGGSWVKHGVTPEMLEIYQRKQYGEWAGMVWVVTEEKNNETNSI